MIKVYSQVGMLSCTGVLNARRTGTPLTPSYEMGRCRKGVACIHAETGSIGCLLSTLGCRCPILKHQQSKQGLRLQGFACTCIPVVAANAGLQVSGDHDSWHEAYLCDIFSPGPEHLTWQAVFCGQEDKWAGLKLLLVCVQCRSEANCYMMRLCRKSRPLTVVVCNSHVTSNHSAGSQ